MDSRGERMHVYFVRHGESIANVENILSTQHPLLHPLTERGRIQAREVGAKLASIRLDAAYSSDLLRAVQTTKLILDGRELPLRITSQLREHNVGELEGRSDEAAWNELSTWYEAWMRGDLAAGPARGEDYHDLNRRFLDFTHELAERHTDPDAGILVVAHAGFFWGGFPALFDNVDLEFMRARGVENGAVIVGRHENARWVCLDWNGEILSTDLDR